MSSFRTGISHCPRLNVKLNQKQKPKKTLFPLNWTNDANVNKIWIYQFLQLQNSCKTCWDLGMTQIHVWWWCEQIVIRLYLEEGSPLFVIFIDKEKQRRGGGIEDELNCVTEKRAQFQYQFSIQWCISLMMEHSNFNQSCKLGAIWGSTSNMLKWIYVCLHMHCIVRAVMVHARG